MHKIKPIEMQELYTNRFTIEAAKSIIIYEGFNLGSNVISERFLKIDRVASLLMNIDHIPASYLRIVSSLTVAL